MSGVLSDENKGVRSGWSAVFGQVSQCDIYKNYEKKWVKATFKTAKKYPHLW